MENKQATLELGTKPVGKLLVQYALPAMIAMTASSLYNIVDRVFIGQGVGAMANERGCAALVSPQLLERYAMSVARWIQCEEAITEFGFLAKHPTTGNAIQSPYVAMSQNFMSQTNRLWMEIYQIVVQNCATEYGGATPQDDVMERLLMARKGL